MEVNKTQITEVEEEVKEYIISKSCLKEIKLIAEEESEYKIFVFINSTSGGNKGKELLEKNKVPLLVIYTKLLLEIKKILEHRMLSF